MLQLLYFIFALFALHFQLPFIRCEFALSPLPHCSLALCLVSLPMYLYSVSVSVAFSQRWRFLYLICGEGYLLLLLLSLSFIVVIRGNALCLHFGCLCYLPTQYMAYVCIYVYAHCLYS